MAMCIHPGWAMMGNALFCPIGLSWTVSGWHTEHSTIWCCRSNSLSNELNLTELHWILQVFLWDSTPHKLVYIIAAVHPPHYDSPLGVFRIIMTTDCGYMDIIELRVECMRTSKSSRCLQQLNRYEWSGQSYNGYSFIPIISWTRKSSFLNFRSGFHFTIYFFERFCGGLIKLVGALLFKDVS